jgi:type IV secretory pathway VirD2 relaxase
LVKARSVQMNARGIEAARLHLNYIERDGVERDGHRVLYGDELDRETLTNALPDERHQFRFIIFPEDAHDVELGEFTRQLMSDVQGDLGGQAVQAASLAASLAEIERSGNRALLPNSPKSPVSTG